MPVIEVGGAPSPTVSIGTSESAASSEPWLPPPRWWLCPARSTNSQPGAAETSTSPAFGLASAPDGTRGSCPAVGHLVEQRHVLVAVAAHDDAAVLLEQDDARPTARSSSQLGDAPRLAV